MLILSRKPNEHIIVGEEIRIVILDIKGDQVRIGIEAPQDVKIYREEVYKAIQEENKRAAIATGEIATLPQVFAEEQSKEQEESEEE